MRGFRTTSDSVLILLTGVGISALVFVILLKIAALEYLCESFTDLQRRVEILLPNCNIFRFQKISRSYPFN